jgi:2-iminobutanoate/2-iminopropanoate deaminase
MEYFPTDPPARIAVRVADASASPGGNAHFALDVIVLAE